MEIINGKKGFEGYKGSWSVINYSFLKEYREYIEGFYDEYYDLNTNTYKNKLKYNKIYSGNIIA